METDRTANGHGRRGAETVRKPKTLGELDEAARDLSRETGWGYERCMVELQRRDRAQIALLDWMERFGVEAERVMQRLAQAVSGRLQQRLQQEAVAKPARVCPRHGAPMPGGLCRRCTRR